jgi:hypothetical protein
MPECEKGCDPQKFGSALKMSFTALIAGFARGELSRLGNLVLGLSLAVGSAGCAGFKPNPGEQAVFMQRAVHGEDPQFRVSVAVPSIDETSSFFDRHLDREGVQPVWVRVENRGDSTVYFLPVAMDRDYFAPLEVTYQYYSAWRPKRNAALDLYFLTNAMVVRIPAHTNRSGFVFTHLDLGEKQVCVSIASDPASWQYTRFTFVVPVPGLETDAGPQQWRNLTNGMETIECDDAQLRAELEKLPRATTDKSGRTEGDPLNLVIIGSSTDLASMSGCGWDRTERVTSGSAWRTMKSFLFGSQYRYSPVSPLYFSGRHQDIALQKARGSINLRSHLRLWLTPLRYDGKPVWIGQVSRDIGVRWTLKTPNLTTHKINPNVDETRAYLVGDLLNGQTVKWWGYVKGVGPAPYWEPRHNLTGDPYFTDGLRVVMELSAQAVRPTDVHRRTEWESPSEKDFIRGPTDR